MSWIKNWKELIKNREKEDGNLFLFGSNCFYGGNAEVITYFSKLEKLGARIELDNKNWETIKVYLPSLNSPSKSNRDSILLFILTTFPAPNDVRYKKDVLMLTWT